MKKFYIYIFLALIFFGCSHSMIKTGVLSEENKINLSSLYIGMTKDQVLESMRYPYKTEDKTFEGEIYEVWYYITEPTQLGQSKLITRNFTPLVFESGRLKGWGRNFYKHTFDIEDEKMKRKEAQRQKYTDDEAEWPRNEHAIIPAINHPVTTEPKDEKDTKDIDKVILEVEHPELKSKQPSTKEPKPSTKNQKNATKKPKNTKKKDAAKTKAEEPIFESSPKHTDERCKQRSDKDEGYYLWE